MNERNHFEPVPQDKFHELILTLSLPAGTNESFLYQLHVDALQGVTQFLNEHPANPIRYINPVVLTLYLIHEHMYYYLKESEEKRAQLEQNQDYVMRIINSAIDKYLTNEHLEFRTGAIKSRYFPPLTTLKLYTNTITGSLSNFKSKQPQQTLFTDIINKSFSLLTCALDLLISGFETEAFSTWRTLHESEAILIILHQHMAEVVPVYLTHLQYGLAFHHLIDDKEKTDAMFAKIKEQMKERGLKSKDLKKFIEYGWLYATASQAEVRLNFRDGVQKVAGLSQYAKTYEMSSEITHSSPLLIYSRRTTFYDITLINLYETFFRLETIFLNRYLPWLSEERQAQYKTLREIYYPQLVNFHRIERTRLINSRKLK